MPTAKAFSLMTLLHGLGIPELFAPELTAEWEFQLAQMEHGNLKRDEFMRDIVKMTEHIVAQAKNFDGDTIPGDFATLTAPCPKCGGEVHENYKKFQCVNPDCDFAFWKIMGGRQLEPAEATDAHHATARSARSTASAARSGGRSRRSSSSPTPTRSSSTSVRAPTTTAARHPTSPARRRSARARSAAIACSRRPTPTSASSAVGPSKSCDFRSGRTILQRPIERAQIEKLLATGKTDLLQFVSARTRRPFSAYLARQKDGSVGFEFEPKDPNRKGRPQRGGAPVRVLGSHPKDKRPVELHAGRYGPYVKHGDVNATLPDKDKMDSLTLDAYMIGTISGCHINPAVTLGLWAMKKTEGRRGALLHRRPDHRRARRRRADRAHHLHRDLKAPKVIDVSRQALFTGRRTDTATTRRPASRSLPWSSPRSS